MSARSPRSAAALRPGAAAASDETLPLEEDQRTREGDILGTPAYMSPEQALGLQSLHGPASDVYSLGAILYHLLAGAHPYTGMGADFFHRVQAASPAPLAEALRQGPPIPVELVRICERAMKRGIPDRYPDASAMAEDLVAFLDGATRREQALSIAERAAHEAPLIAALREQSASLEAEARRLLAGVRPFDPPEQKAPAWDLQDEAAKLGREAALREVEWLEGMHGALSVDPELPAAHDALSGYYKDRLIEAERTGRSGDAILFEALLRSHDRGRYAALLRGEGALTLVTDPPGASVALHRYVEEGRRLVPRLVGEIGPTPILERPIQTGSYLCVIRAEGRAEVRYPVLIERGGHWDGVPPGGRAPEPIPLPREDEIAPFEVYVPAGWCWTGGDPMAIDSLPGRRLWIDAFMMQRYPITNIEYIQFLNDLVDAGRRSEAEAACPRVQRAVAGTEDNRPAFAKDDAGRFALPSGNDWLPDLPVVLVDGRAVSAFARWLAERTGLPFRLAGELEREKAARGVDGRQYPWGDHAESTFACVAEGQEGEAAREPVTGHPQDESVYGARGLAGNVRDWCADAWTHEGPPVEKDRWLVGAAPDEHAEFRVVKGGNWAAPIAHCRAASRFGARPGLYRLTVGARVVRNYSPRPGRPTNR